MRRWRNCTSIFCAAVLAICPSSCRAAVLALVILVMGSIFGTVSDLSQQLIYSFLEEDAVLRDQTVSKATVISSSVSTRTQSKGMDSGSEFCSGLVGGQLRWPSLVCCHSGRSSSSRSASQILRSIGIQAG